MSWSFIASMSQSWFWAQICQAPKLQAVYQQRTLYYFFSSWFCSIYFAHLDMTIYQSEMWSPNFLIYKIEVLPIRYRVIVKFNKQYISCILNQVNNLKWYLMSASVKLLILKKYLFPEIFEIKVLSTCSLLVPWGSGFSGDVVCLRTPISALLSDAGLLADLGILSRWKRHSEESPRRWEKSS